MAVCEITVCKMTEDDILQVEVLEQACFHTPWTAEMLADTLKHTYDYVWVIKEVQKETPQEEAMWKLQRETQKEERMEVPKPEKACIVGYCNLRILAGEGEIMRIAVSPERRRQGLGRKLMEEMLNCARKNGCEAVLLEVRESNQSARNLYESYGFLVEGIRKNYYQSPRENAVLMGKRQM